MKENNKQKYKCVVIDDEPLAIEVIEEHLLNFDNLELAGSYTRALDAIGILNNEEIDLLFLDINMPGISGMEFLKSLSNPPKVIFTTAYRNFAVDAFDMDAVDYLLKPISFERFLKATNRFFSQSVSSAEKNDNPPATIKNFIVVKSDKKNYKLRFEDIVLIESLDNYVKIHTDDLSIVCYRKLSDIEKELPAEHFSRIHRSYIVNIAKIKVFTTSWVQIGNQKFTIGRNYKAQFLSRLS